MNFPAKTRQLRLFISSTFSDMNRERDVLLTVFPQIEKICSARGIEFIPIDLRWGITEEEAKKGGVFETCMKEIDESRPFFIGILGNRYGWIPSAADIKDFDNSIRARFPWIEDALKQGLSITEMEMRYAALDHLNEKDFHLNAAFFIKNSGDSSAGLSAEKDSEAERKLSSLKNKITSQKKYPVSHFSNPEQLSSLVLKTLKAYIDAEFPEKETETYEKLFVENEKLLIQRSESLFDLGRYRNLWQNWVDDKSSKYLLVSGYSGRGKSFFAANAVQQLRSSEQNIAAIYCDCSLRSDPDSLYEYILFELANASGLKNRRQSNRSSNIGCVLSVLLMMIKIPFITLKYALSLAFGNMEKAQEKLGEDFNDSLIEAQSAPTIGLAKKLMKKLEKGVDREIFLVIDNADNMSADIASAMLDFLSIIPSIRIVFVTSPTSVIHSTIEHILKPTKLSIGNLTVAQSREYVTNYLKKYGKKLDEKGTQCNRIVSSKYGGSPILLSHILNLLVCFGSFEEIDNYITELASIENETELYRMLVKSICGKDFGSTVRNRLAEKVLCALSLVPKGLSESEIIEIFKPGTLDWAMIRPFILTICKKNDSRIFLSSEIIVKAVRLILNEKSASVSESVSLYFENLLKGLALKTDLLDAPDTGKLLNDQLLLKRQVEVLLPLYYNTGDLENLHLWATYSQADRMLSESERIEYWRVLYRNGFCLHTVIDTDIPPALKRLGIRMSEDRRIGLYIEGSLIRTTKKDRMELLHRWSKIAGMNRNFNDCAWLARTLEDHTSEDLETSSRFVEVIRLFEAQDYDSVLKQYHPCGNDLVQAVINCIVAKVHIEKNDYETALRVIAPSIALLNSTGLIYKKDYIAFIDIYSLIIANLGKSEEIASTIGILSYHKVELLRQGFTSVEIILVQKDLALLNFAIGNNEQTISEAKIWQQALDFQKVKNSDCQMLIKAAEARLS